MVFAAITNLFDATFGDGRIGEERVGQVQMASPESHRFFSIMKESLATSKIAEYEIKADSSPEIKVWMTTRISCNEHDFKNKILLMVGGAWEPRPVKENILDLGKDPAVRQFCNKVVQAVLNTQKITDVVKPEDLILRQLIEVLKPDIQRANSRIFNELEKLVAEEHIRLQAIKAWEDVMRVRVHSALSGFEKVGPEALHRFVDELFCKRIHDA